MADLAQAQPIAVEGTSALVAPGCVPGTCEVDVS